MGMPPVKQRAFRNALGAFATGVTIATTKDANGHPVGVTASSFNSVSLDPPLVLWSLAKNSRSLDAFCTSGHFAVHVLAAEQEELSNRFARSGEDKFAELEWSNGHCGSPVLGDYAALFQCKTRHQYEGGDHVILVGEVVDYDAHDKPPLLFHAGRYAEPRPRPNEPARQSVDPQAAYFSDDFLLYLISRAHFQTSRPTREMLAELGSSMEEYLTLAVLSMESPLGREDIARRLSHTGHAPSPRLLDHMARRKLIRRIGQDVRAQDAPSYELAPAGKELFVQTLAFGKALEADLANHFTAAELEETRRILRRIIELTGKDVPIGWRDKG